MGKSKCDFYTDFFQTRLWVKFLEMKKIPEQLMHWINIKIFDESIIKKENDYYLKFTKVGTPFLDEKKDKEMYKFPFVPNEMYQTPGAIRSLYYEKRDSQSTLIEYYTTLLKDGENIKVAYNIIPCFVSELLPNHNNFRAERFAPDLNKDVVEQDKLLKDMKIKRKIHRYLNIIKCENAEDDMIVIWVIMWCLCFKFIQGNDEKEFRVDQLAGVLWRALKNSKTFKQPLPLFQDIFETLLKFGDIHQIIQMLVLMNYLKIKRNLSIDNIFFNAVRKNRDHNKKKTDKKDVKPMKISDMITEMEQKKVSRKIFHKWETSLNPNHKSTLEIKSKFMRRTFKEFKVR